MIGWIHLAKTDVSIARVLEEERKRESTIISLKLQSFECHSSFHFFMFQLYRSNYKNVSRITHSYRKKITLTINARLYDENSNTNARTQVRKEGWAIHLDAMSIAARQQKYEEVMSRLAHATSDNSTRRTKSQNRLVALTRREPALRTALSAAKARLAAQQRRLHCFSSSLLCKTHIRSSQVRPCFGMDSHCRKSNESRQRRAREEELVWEGEQLVARKSANF